jgi:hypothetical protein
MVVCMNVSKAVLPMLLLAAALGCGYSNNSMMATMPAINQLSPSSTTAGSAQFQLEVDGANFSPNAIVNFNGVAESTTFVSAGKLEATIPSTAILSSGTVPVTVTNPASTGRYTTPASTSAPMNFTIN